MTFQVEIMPKGKNRFRARGEMANSVVVVDRLCLAMFIMQAVAEMMEEVKKIKDLKEEVYVDRVKGVEKYIMFLDEYCLLLLLIQSSSSAKMNQNRK